MTADAGLAGRVVLITGASRGLGAELAVACASAGARLVLVARTRGALEEVDDRVRAAGGEATLVPSTSPKVTCSTRSAPRSTSATAASTASRPAPPSSGS